MMAPTENSATMHLYTGWLVCTHVPAGMDRWRHLPV